MKNFGQRCVDYLVKRPVGTLASLGLLCLILMFWQGVRTSEETHELAATEAAASHARAFEALAATILRGSAGRAIDSSAGAAPRAARALLDLASQVNRRRTYGRNRPTTRLAASQVGYGLPLVRGRFELEATRLFRAGRTRPYTQVVSGQRGRMLLYAVPLRIAGLDRPTASAGRRGARPRFLQIVTAPLPGSLVGLSQIFSLPLLLLIVCVGAGLFIVIFLFRRMRSLAAEGKDLAMLAVKRNEQLQEAVDSAHHANQAKSDFLAKMSHELRTPLNAIIGFSDIIRSPYGERMAPEKRKEYADDIHNSGTHLLSVINEILDISRIEAGHLELEEDRFSLVSLIEPALRIVHEQAETAGLTLDVRVAENAPDIWADRRALRQVLINLLANAIKFTDPGGVVSLMAWFDESGRLVINVADSGMGISPENLRKVLKPFEQVESAMSRKNYGTGLGLPIAKNIVEHHGGIFHLESELHKGTTVTMVLPAERVYWVDTAPAPQHAEPTPLLDAETGQPLAYAKV